MQCGVYLSAPVGEDEGGGVLAGRVGLKGVVVVLQTD